MADWSPSKYLQFADERTRAARDLLAQVPLTAPRRVVDMGCGPGNSTELLVARFPDAEVIGLDSSPAMLDEARKQLPGVRFDSADATSWVPEPGTDLVFANAIYQWVPDHLAALERVAAALPEGGVLAVQMPDNMGEPSHMAMNVVGLGGPWAARLKGKPRPPLPTVAKYYDRLKPHLRALDIWHSVYNHVLDGPAAVVEWVKGTGLRPFLEPLTPEEQTEYLKRYLEQIGSAYPPRADGKVLLRFPRLFIVGVK